MSLDHGAGFVYRVVDASVSLKWALDDEDAVDEAAAFRDAAIEGRFQMVAPSLWAYEVTNGLVVATRRGRLAAEAGAEALRYLMAMRVRLADPEPRDVYAQAHRHGVAANDAAYLALAALLRVGIWTGDRRFYEALRDAKPLVRWIGDYAPE